MLPVHGSLLPRATVLVVRHPLSTFNQEGRWAGWQDAPLAEDGWRQAAEAAELWAEHPVGRVVSSDLRRAADAASLLAARLGVPHTRQHEWRERNAGEWQGVRVADLSEDPHYLAWRSDPRVCPPAGEPYRMFSDRLARALEQLRQDPLLTLVVAHGGVLDVLAAELGVPGAVDWRPRPLLDALAVGREGPGWFFAADRPLLPVASPLLRPPAGCFSCDVVPSAGHLLAFSSPLTLLSHTADAGREGWFVLSPRRHVRSLRDLTHAEADELLLLSAAADRALAEHFGSRRTLVASLGWYVSDHLHIHLVPTFRSEVSYGSLNFDGAYLPFSGGRDEAVRRMAAALRSDLQLGRLR